MIKLGGRLVGALWLERVTFETLAIFMHKQGGWFDRRQATMGGRSHEQVSSPSQICLCTYA